MSYLLFPGRHLVNTAFQHRYVRGILHCTPNEMPGIIPSQWMPTGNVTEVVYAITSSNQSNSRYNPIPFHIRAISVDRFARSIGGAASHHIFGIPHYGHIRSFADFTVKQIRDQSEGLLELTPENCIVLCSTPEVIELYRELGFAIVTAEQTEPGAPTPIRLIQAIGTGDAGKLENGLAESTKSLFADFPEVPLRIERLYRDPLTNQEGSLTATRNYNSYARGMNEILRLKYLDIAPAIQPGRIADEGCADGGLLAEVAHDFPDSDLYGIDLSAEFAHRFEERRRAGDFGGSYVHFFLRNLLDPIFEPNSIDTTICNSTLHELWSYAAGERTVRDYLGKKFRQLRPGGRLIIRDVVGPEDGDAEVHLTCSTTDGAECREDIPDRGASFLSSLSTNARFRLFLRDFRRGREIDNVGLIVADSNDHLIEGRYSLPLRFAAEFLSKKDYTDNWASEMNEEFCFWSFTQWTRALQETGFEIVAQSSRVYCNPWIAENRYDNHVTLTYGPDPIPYPPTNMVLVAQKSHQ